MHMNCSSGGPVLPSNGLLNNLEPLFVLDKHQLEVEPSWLPSSNHRKPVCTEMKLKDYYRKAGSKEKMKKSETFSSCGERWLYWLPLSD